MHKLANCKSGLVNYNSSLNNMAVPVLYMYLNDLNLFLIGMGYAVLLLNIWTVSHW
jgi:hypothetical protein